MDQDVKRLQQDLFHIKREDDRRSNAYTKKFALIKAQRQELEGRIAALEAAVAELQAAKKKGKAKS